MTELLSNLIYIPFLATVLESHDISQSFLGLFSGRPIIYGVFAILVAALAYVSHALTSPKPAWFTTSVYFDDDTAVFKQILGWVAQQSEGRPYRKLNYSSNKRHEPGPHELDNSPDKLFHFKRHSAMSSIIFEPSYGVCSFFHRGRLFVFRRTQEKGYYGSDSRETISLETPSWSPEPLEELIHTIRLWAVDRGAGYTNVWVPKHTKELCYGEPWRKRQARPSRTMDSVILNPDEKQRIIKDISEYLQPAQSQWYANRGIPYRRGYLLHGLPGTGKSSLSFALAGLFGLDIYVLSLSGTEMTNTNLGDLFNNLPERCIVLLEDIDASGFTKVRTTKRADHDDSRQKLSLDGLLNVIDGVDSPLGRILIMTTNHKDRLDSALIRPGRIDFEIEFTYATREELRKLFTHIYGDNGENASRFAKSIPENTFTLAQIQGFLLEHPNDSCAAVDGITAWVNARAEGKRL
ncbi:hypothetical protein HBH98_248250 [Parastagonospora nodorum]|nr:hypothetical protein HBH53_261730 [Parastagonospora nodorum]KAH3956076.1 hypothetical protein HBH51_256270 [Parastagonospora nodorum]KAH4215329.1 hypothetical protein HBI06_256430 [Parastagonospora nodorum]KAH4222565.1 hypothetical protein HBI05_253800 [Parastagonospora nodorum]KAH4333503.1 hypothetical protein HBH98_248250 [Parastagonospora nodorum]